MWAIKSSIPARPSSSVSSIHRIVVTPITPPVAAMATNSSSVLFRDTGVRASAFAWFAMIGLVDRAAVSSVVCRLECDTSTSIPNAFISAMAKRPRSVTPPASSLVAPVPKPLSASGRLATATSDLKDPETLVIPAAERGNVCRGAASRAPPVSEGRT